MLTSLSSWRHVKEDYLCHFSLPRVDLLVWIMITKLAPRYYQKIDVILNNTGRFRELPSWRRDFKAAWKKAIKTPITMPLNERYRPDAKQFVCTCPQFVVSRFLICKHLVQLFQPVNPIFFLEVTRNRTIPFWSHPTLKPLSSIEGDNEADDQVITSGDGEDDKADEDAGPYKRLNAARLELGGSEFESDDDWLVDTWEGQDGERKPYEEEMRGNIQILRDFCDGLEYQIQFEDLHFLETLEREGARFFKLARNCLSREKRSNSSRVASPTTWERSTANAMFYRSRPLRERDC